jgi:Spy/CpxP family protein refolding chaperone
MRTAAMLAVLATAASLPLAAQQPDSTHSAMGHAYGHRGAGYMTHGGMAHAAMMSGGMGGYGMASGGMMVDWMRYGMGMDSSTMLPIVRRMAFLPQRLLAERTALKLTPAQVTRLQAIEQDMQSAHAAMWRQAQPQMERMALRMEESPPDTAAVRRDYNQMSEAMSVAHWSVISAALHAREVLTKAQRQQVDASAGTWSNWMMQGAGIGMGVSRNP